MEKKEEGEAMGCEENRTVWDPEKRSFNKERLPSGKYASKQ